MILDLPFLCRLYFINALVTPSLLVMETIPLEQLGNGFMSVL